MSPLDLQRIIDGELDHTARAQMLGSLGDDVREWRSLALALLEDQQWSRELCNDPSLSDQIPRMGPGTLPSVSGAANIHSHQTRPSGSSWFTVLAACMLLGVGMVGGVLFRGSQSNTTGNAISSSAGDLKQDHSLPMKMVLSGLGGSDIRPLEIPVVEASQMDPSTLWDRDAQEIAALQQRLKREGHRMEWKPQLYSGRLSDGSQIVVPVHNVTLKSVGL